jgi:restriction system protein
VANINRRRQGEMMLTTFAVLQEHEGGLPARRVLDEVMRRLPPTDFEAGTYDSTPDKPRFHKILRFTSISSVKAGWLIKRKGTWSVTQEGIEAVARFPDPEEFIREATRLYNEWKRGRPVDVADEVEDVDVEEYSAATTLEEAEESAWSEIRAYLAKMPPYEFQDLVAALLRGMGYYVNWVSPPGPDGNMDIVAYVDRLGAEGPRIKVEVKRYNHGRVGAEKLRSFLAVLGQQDVGIYVALEGFSKDAVDIARTDANRRVTLLTGEELVDLWVEHQDSLETRDRALLPLRPIWFLSPE